ncbi:hypothetical protein [Nannocystis bainbridge]|uniref:DUF4878 domain-containing protein n=1 Tax=Nannocystis bainbridge TaxID=2995303 RepID=A0ABT5E7G7_9BACT|nr:hypothetical protein [Nannocystis bainbridge]MDC0720767.1 hypothetical protein [Nannocystis bainbridge]
MTRETCLQGHPEAARAAAGPADPDMPCPEGQVAPLPAIALRPSTSAATALEAVLSTMSSETCPSGHPRSPIPAVLRTAALICWAALAGACGNRSGDPVRTAQAFTAAVQRGDMDAVYGLIERAASEQLVAAAAQASDQVGGRRRIEPAEMLQIVDVDPNFELASAELLGDVDLADAEDGTFAQVRLNGSQQESHTLTLVREEGAWRVRIPLPPLNSTATTP